MKDLINFWILSILILLILNNNYYSHSFMTFFLFVVSHFLLSCPVSFFAASIFLLPRAFSLCRELFSFTVTWFFFFSWVFFFCREHFSFAVSFFFAVTFFYFAANIFLLPRGFLLLPRALLFSRGTCGSLQFTDKSKFEDLDERKEINKVEREEVK